MGFFLVLMEILPSLIGLVKQAETTIGTGNGPAKLNLVLNTVNAAVSAVPVVAKTIEGHDLNGAVTSIVNATVNVLNSAGLLKTTAPPSVQP